MCCLFGLLNYGNVLKPDEIRSVISSLAIASTARGVDATGLAYLHGSNIVIQKAPKPATKFKFTLSGKTIAVVGHTRLTTQGSENNNYNNHPFLGIVGTQTFALAHNGIINNIEHEYLQNLKLLASCEGFENEIIDYLHYEGFTFQEIEELIYESSPASFH